MQFYFWLQNYSTEEFSNKFSNKSHFDYVMFTRNNKIHVSLIWKKINVL